MNQFKEKIQISIKKHQYFLFMFFFFVFVYLYTSIQSDSSASNEKLLTVDTLIPKDHVLVPIELENQAAITGLIENYGIVDIYEKSLNSNMSKKILQKVKILKAPFNPEVYSVLLPEQLSDILLKHQGPFSAVIQNKSTDSEPNPAVLGLPQHKEKTVKIEYNGG